MRDCGHNDNMALMRLTAGWSCAWISLVVFFGCSAPSPRPEPPPREVDGGTCESACDNAAVLGCPSFGNAGPDGVPDTADDEVCGFVCLLFLQDGVEIDLRCLTAASTCKQYGACE